MLKPHIAYCLVLTALTAAPVMAQTKSEAEAGGIQFITEQSPDQWRGSKLIGINVVGPNEEKIGAISEVLVDHSGDAQAAVIGVGGFLGIGQKDVAIPFKTLKWVSHEEAAAAAASKAPASPPPTAANSAHHCTRCGYGCGYCPGRQAGDRCQSRLPASCGRQHDQGRTEEGTRLPLYRSFLAMNVTRASSQ